MFLGLLSVIGTTTPDSFFFPADNSPFSQSRSAQKQTRLPPKPTPTFSQKPLISSIQEEKPITSSPSSVNGFIENKVISTLNQKLNNEGIPANFIRISNSQQANLEEEINIIHKKLNFIERESHLPVTPGDNSIKIDSEKQTIKVNPTGIPFFATINGGIVTNLQDFLNVSTATLNTITALGGVNEGVNQGQAQYINRGDIFHRKEGNRFYFRTFVSHDNSITFSQSKDNKTIDLKVNLAHDTVHTVHIADKTVTGAKLADKTINSDHLHPHSITQDALAPYSVSLDKLQAVDPKSILGNPDDDTKIPRTIKLDSQSLYFNTEGKLAVKTGEGGLNLSKIQGKISLENINSIPSGTLLGNAQAQSQEPQAISLDPAHFSLENSAHFSRLSLNTHLIAEISSPFSNYQGRIQQKEHLPVDIGNTQNTRLPSALTVHGEADVLSLTGRENAFIRFYPHGISKHTAASVGFVEKKSESFSIQNNSSNNNAILINPNGGNVSIGSSKSKAKLQIGEHIFVHDDIEKNISWNSYFEETGWKKSQNGSAYQWAYNSQDPDSNLSLRSSSKSRSGMPHGWTTALVIDPNSLVGIGTSPANGYQLNILGDQKIHGRIDISRTGQAQPFTYANSISINETADATPRIGFSRSGNSEGWIDFNNGAFTFGRDQAFTTSLLVNGGVRTLGGPPQDSNGYTFQGKGYTTATGIFSSKPGQLDFYTDNRSRFSIINEGTLCLHKNIYAQLHLSDSNQPVTPHNGDIFHHAGSLKGYFSGIQRTYTGLVYSNTASALLQGGTGLIGTLLQSGFEEYGTRTIPLELFKNKWRLMRIKLSGEVTGEGNDQGSFIVRLETSHGSIDFPIAPHYNPYVGIDEPMFPAQTMFSTELTMRGFDGEKGLTCIIATNLFSQSVFKSFPGSYYTKTITIQDSILEGNSTFDVVAKVPFSTSGKTKLALNQITIEILN